MLATNLDMDVLRALVIAIDLGGFGRAAERLGRSQSAISLQMKKLEEQVGQPLFRRNGRSVALTAAGDLVLDYARRIVDLNDEVMTAIRGGSAGGGVRLGVPLDLAERWLPPVLRAFHRSHPRVQVETHVGRGRELRERIASNSLDLALVLSDIDGGGGDLGGGTVLARLPLMWIGPPGFRPDPKAPLPLALLDQPCPFRRHGTARLDRCGRPWRLSFSSPSLAGLWAAVDAGLGLTVRSPLGLPETLAPVAPQAALPVLGSVSLELHGPPANHNSAAAHLRTTLVDALRQVL